MIRVIMNGYGRHGVTITNLHPTNQPYIAAVNEARHKKIEENEIVYTTGGRVCTIHGYIMPNGVRSVTVIARAIYDDDIDNWNNDNTESKSVTVIVDTGAPSIFSFTCTHLFAIERVKSAE